MSITHEDLFALRFSLQDVFVDESEIVKRLKIKLLDSGMNEEDTNNYLVEFYAKYGINFNLDEIQNINVTNLNQNNTSNNPLISNNPFSNNPMISNLNNPLIQFLLNPNSVYQENEEDNEDNEDDEDNADNADNEINEDNENNVNENNDEVMENGEGVEDDIDEDDDVSEDYLDMPPLVDVEPEGINTDTFTNFVSPFTWTSQNRSINLSFNGRNYNFVSNVNNGNTINSAQNFASIFNNFMNQVGNNQNQQNMDDVVVTLDDTDKDNIKCYKVEEKDDKKVKCTICMDYCEKGEEVSELKCKHVFHKECIMEYFNNYNYKCPVCRLECGKPKYNT